MLYADWGFSLGALADLALAEDVQGLAAAERGEEAGGGEVRDLAVRLAVRLEANPEDLDGWFLLGRTRLQLGEFEGAAQAFGEVASRAPESVAPRVFQAQALYMADDRALTTRVRALVDAVLTLDPQQPIMLELLGMDAFQNRRFAEAADLFARVLGAGIEDEARRRFLEDGLARARELAVRAASRSCGPSTSVRASAQTFDVGARTTLGCDALAASFGPINVKVVAALPVVRVPSTAKLLVYMSISCSEK